MGSVPLSDYVQLVSTIVTAIATAVLAWFGGVQIWAERSKRRSEQRSADARLSAAAFELRKPLVDWILRSQEKGWSVNSAQEALKEAAGILPRLAQGLLADTPAASPSIAARVRTAYAYCQSAAVKFDSYLGQYHAATQAQLHGVDADAAHLADTGLLSDGRENLRGCCNELERVIDPALLAEAKRLGAWRTV